MCYNGDRKERIMVDLIEYEKTIKFWSWGKRINLLIERFEPINPSFKRIYRNKTQREALERLVSKYGFKKVWQMIDALPEIVNQKYAPRITTPYQLEEKLGSLLVFINQLESCKSIIKV